MCLICVCVARPSVCVDSPSGLIRRQVLLQPPHPRVQLAGPRCPVMFAHIVYGGAKRGPILPLDTRRNLVFTRAHFALAEFPNRAPVREAAIDYVSKHHRTSWARELDPWMRQDRPALRAAIDYVSKHH